MAYAGVSTKDTGDAIRLSYQGVTATANHVPDRIYVTMHYDAFAVLLREGCLLQTLSPSRSSKQMLRRI